jgi:hypothetical protein
MLKDLEQLKKQLSDLSEVINKFKSEAVQLKIVEYLFEGTSEAAASPKTTDVHADGSRKRRRKKASRRGDRGASGEEAKGRGRRGGKGAVAVLSELVDGDFFNQKRTIGDIVEHCVHTQARRYKANEFSGALGRHTRNGVLRRVKNAEGQYEYSKP